MENLSVSVKVTTTDNPGKLPKKNYKNIEMGVAYKQRHIECLSVRQAKLGFHSNMLFKCSLNTTKILEFYQKRKFLMEKIFGFQLDLERKPKETGGLLREACRLCDFDCVFTFEFQSSLFSC